MFKEVPTGLHMAVTLACPAHRARDLLTTEKGLLSWLAREAWFEPAVGAEYRLDLGQPWGPAQGRIRGFDPSSGIAYTLADAGVERAFGVTVARWAWEPLSADFALVTLAQTGYGQGDAWQSAYALHLQAWSFFLGNLASVVNEGRDRRHAGAHP